jgi:glycosyltransferase involved in cell wall biosynthesis
MKICFFLLGNPTSGFNPEWGGGSELALYYLATQLAKSGEEVHVIIDSYKKGGWQTADGVQVHEYRVPNNPLGAYAATKRIIGEVCYSSRPDTIVGFELCPRWPKITAIDALVNTVVSRGVPLTYYAGNHYPWLVHKDESNPWMLWRSLRKAVGSASVLIAASTVMVNAIARNMGIDASCVEVVPFGVPLGEYASWDTDRSERKGKVVFTGRIVPHKGLRELIEAARILRDRGETKSFILIGPRGNLWEDSLGQYYLELQRLSEAYGLNSTLRFTGVLPRAEVVRIMCSSNVFAFPSHAEGFGVALIQAMAAGAVPAVYRIEPLTEIVGDAGVYAKLGDPHSLADAISQADFDPHLPESVEERVERYSIQRVAKQFVDVLEHKKLNRPATAETASGAPKP